MKKSNIRVLLFLLVIIPWIASLKNSNMTGKENCSLPLLTDSSTLLTGDLNYMAEGDYITLESITLSGESLFNISCSSMGNANLFFYFTSSVTRYSYYSNRDSIIWSDVFLTTYGKPGWGANWDSWFLNDDISNGIEVIAGNEKSFLISIGNGDSFEVSINIRLVQTTNSSNNTYKINIVDLLDSNIPETIVIGPDNTTQLSIPANGFKLFKFVSLLPSNNVFLTNDININGSFSWIYWHDTLTNIWAPLEESFTENISRDWVPLFNNYDLTGRDALGIVFNFAESELNLTYTSRLALESNNRIEVITYSGISEFSTKILANENMTSAYCIIEMEEVCFFDASFQTDLNWSVSVNFYSLGTNHGQKAVINTQGVNGIEKLSIFYAPISNIYQDRDTALFIEQQSHGIGWYAINGTLSPEVIKINPLSSLIGFRLNAINNGLNPDVNITIQLSPRNVTTFSNGEEVAIGKTSDGKESTNFPFLQVRQFDTLNWRRYQYELQAYNKTNLKNNTYWFCGVEGSDYVNNMNNSLYSIQINNTNNYSDLRIEVKISYKLSTAQMGPSGGDKFSIYIMNDTIRNLLNQYTGSSDDEVIYSEDISDWIGKNFTIEFNLFTNSFGTDIGVTVDDFKIKGNSTLIIHENDFENSISGWTHVDYSGEGDLWHTTVQEVGFNRPIVDIVYRETRYNLIGEKPSLIGVGAYPKIFFDKDPKIQPTSSSYFVYYADGPIENNFTIKLSATIFDPVTIANNQVKFTNDFIYLEAEQQGSEVVMSPRMLERPRWYYRVDITGLSQLIIKLSENSVLQEHSSITIALYDQYGQTPFKSFYLETQILYEGLSILQEVKTSDLIILSIEGLNYNDYIELELLELYSSTPFDPTIIIVLLITSIALGAVGVLIFYKYRKISKEYSSLKIHFDTMQKKLNSLPPFDKENFKKNPLNSSEDPKREPFNNAPSRE